MSLESYPESCPWQLPPIRAVLFDRNRGAVSPTSIGVEQGLSPCLVSLSSPVEACLCQGELPASELQRGRASCANSYVIGGRLQPGLLSDA